MVVDIYFPALETNKFVSGPTGFYSYPVSLSENPQGSGLLDIPTFLTTEDSMLYSIPLNMLSAGGKPNSNLMSFAVLEEATPIDPASSQGGVGEISVNMDDFFDAPRMIGEVVLADGSRGKTSGIVRRASSVDGVLSLTADSSLGLFNTEKTALPYVGTLGGAVQYYCDMVGITNDVIVDSVIRDRPVVYPGWTGNAWVHMKQLLAVEQVEMSLVFDRVSVRPLRRLEANQDKMSSAGWSLDGDGGAQRVEVYYYNHRVITNGEVYPLNTEEANIYTIGAGETQTFLQRINGTLSSVNQPEVISFVENRSYAGTNGVYSVTGNDDLPITPAQWKAQGGFVSVRVTEDPSVIEVTVRGASMPSLAPYRLAMSAGSGSAYNSLHVTGTGVAWDRKSIILHTGASASSTSTDIGVTVDNPFLSSLTQAYSVGMKTAQAYAGINYTITGTAYDLNRTGQGRDLIKATVEDFNLAYDPGTLVSEFNVEWEGQTAADFTEYWDTQVDLLWENQLFGNAPGARIKTPDANFRVIRASTSEDAVQFTATMDTMVIDFNETWAGVTAGEFSAEVIGSTSKDFSVVPLRRAN